MAEVTPSPASDDLDELLSWSIVRAARVVGQRMTERLAAYDVNPLQFGVLAHLSSVAAMTQAELTRIVFVRAQSISPLLDTLEARGLVARATSRARGRRNPVWITDEGREMLARLRGVVAAANDLSDVGLSSVESAELNRLLLRIVHAKDQKRA